jgi:hypothetical protein
VTRIRNSHPIKNPETAVIRFGDVEDRAATGSGDKRKRRRRA